MTIERKRWRITLRCYNCQAEEIKVITPDQVNFEGGCTRCGGMRSVVLAKFVSLRVVEDPEEWKRNGR